MEKLIYGSYDPTIFEGDEPEPLVFDENKGYVNASGESENRKQLSMPLTEVKNFVNKTVSVNSSNQAIQLVLDSNNRLKFRTTEGGTLNNVRGVQANWSETDTNSDAYIQNKPTIPTVNNGTLTLKVNGVVSTTFSANQSTNAEYDVVIPTDKSVFVGETFSAGSNSVGATIEDFVAEPNDIIFLNIKHVPSGSQVQLTVNDVTAYISKSSSSLEYVTASEFSLGKVMAFLYNGTYYVLIETGGGGGSVTVDSVFSTTSTNPVQNKVIANAINRVRSTTISAGNTTASLSIRPTVDHPNFSINAYTVKSDMSGRYVDVPFSVEYSAMPSLMVAGTTYTLYFTLDEAQANTTYIVLNGGLGEAVM